MESGNKKHIIALDIAYEIMTRNHDPLILSMMHPGGGQYNCLALLAYDGSHYTPKLLITLNGNGVHGGDRTISPYPELYEKNRADLIDRIAREFKIRLWETPIWDCPSVSFLKKILELDSVTMLSAWYEDSYQSKLEDDAKNFPYYPWKDERDLDKHIHWWLIQADKNTIAMVNLKTAILIDEDGSSFNLDVECDEAMNSVKRGILRRDFMAIVDKTRLLLKQNDEWHRRYEGYAQKIVQNLDFIKSVRASFRQWVPLTVYLNTTFAQNAKRTIVFDLRYYGQTIARITGYANGKHKLSTKGFEKSNLIDFDCDLQLNEVDWAGPEATEFRKYFKNRKGPRKMGENKGNEEHRLESLWITELQKQSDKVLPYAKVVEVGKTRFPMPTPLSASNHKTVKYSGIYGGGIDILARIGTGGSNTYLCIMELKDENEKSEPPIDALKQAIAYTTFIRELLRSETSRQWWILFGLNGEIPKQLTLYAACVMPSSVCNDYSFKDMTLDIEGDIIKLHYVYFVEKDNKITEVDTSLRWS
ncbi:MAG: hypothetical protein ACM3S4_03635 [Burkholderiales bacterium]